MNTEKLLEIMFFVNLWALAVLNGSIILGFFYFQAFKFNKNNIDKSIAARNPTIITGQVVREYWYWLTRPILNGLIRLKFTPNRITFSAFLIGVGASLSFFYGFFGLAGWLFILSGTFDILDGQLARETGTDSPVGAFIDSVIDRYADFFAFSGLIMYVWVNAPTNIYGSVPTFYFVPLSLLAMLGSTVISYSKERGSNLGVVEDRGLMQRADRVMVLGFCAAFDPLVNVAVTKMGYPLLAAFHPLLGFGLFMIAFLGNRTAIIRVIRITRGLNEKYNENNHQK